MPPNSSLGIATSLGNNFQNQSASALSKVKKYSQITLTAQEKQNGLTTLCISSSVPAGINGLILRRHKCLAYACVVKHKDY